MSKDERLSREETIFLYQDDAKVLLQYYNWISKMSGQNIGKFYTGDNIEEHSMTLPVYDSTLLAFIKAAKGTEFMNKNYIYTYSRLRMKTVEDELEAINHCSLLDIKVIGDILSKYCYRGDVRGVTWNEGLQHGIYLAILDKLKQLLEIRNI